MNEELQARAAAYTLGALEPDEARAFEAQLADRADLQALVRELREVSAALASGAPALMPDAGLRARVLAAARAPSSSSSSAAVIPISAGRRALPAGLAWAAMIGALLLAGVQTIRVQRRNAVVASLSADVDNISRRRAVLEERLDAILDGHTTMNVIQPTGADNRPRYGAQVFWRADQQTWLVHVFDMPRLPAGSVYQLWYVTPTLKISAGVFEVDSLGHGIKLLHLPPDARGATLAAMSVEPGPQGSAQPTGPIVLAGAVRTE